MHQSPTSSLTVALTLVVGLSAGVAAAGEAKTPLGKWMKPNVGAALAGQDFATLQKSLDLVASKSPGPSYPKWASIAQAGSAAAAKQDVAAIKASCKQCHEMYKEQYIKDFPTRAFP
jgi:hypothetical protein